MASLQRALLLREHHRSDEAIAEIKLVLAEDPDNPEAHSELAITLLDLPGRKKEALEAIESAIAIEADQPDYLSIKALVLSAMDRGKEALPIAQNALGYFPGPFQWYAKAVAHVELKEWSAAESACNQALEIDPDYDAILNLKNTVLRMQGRLNEADRNTEVQLSRNAENPDALANAGWAKLQRGDSKKAEELFLEALRSDPENEYARGGLIEAYKARSLFYRIYLKWAFFIQKMAGKSQWALIIGIYLAFRFGRAILNQIHPALGLALVVVYLVFIFGSFIAPGIGHFLLFKDRLARLALDRREKLDGLAVGGLFFVGIAAAITGVAIEMDGVMFLGISFAAASVPAALVFRNYSKIGQTIFGGVVSFTIASGITCLVSEITKGDPMTEPAGPMFLFSIIAIMICTWLSNIGSLLKFNSVE